ncbi:MAG: response regulator, partial [Candidatus Thermoplasmatota archaeon]|nr:response regulator [Candidatus Thermoplasmatota archaeon]
MVQPIRVLLIEDDQATAALIERYLEEAGMDPIWAARGEAGLEALDEHPDVVLLDHRLPDTDGLSLLEPILDRPHPPIVIFLTGGGSPTVAQEALSKGAVDYRVKSPETFQALPRIVAQAWDEWGSLDTLARTKPQHQPDGPPAQDLATFLETGGIRGLV